MNSFSQSIKKHIFLIALVAIPLCSSPAFAYWHGNNGWHGGWNRAPDFYGAGESYDQGSMRWNDSSEGMNYTSGFNQDNGYDQGYSSPATFFDNNEGTSFNFDD